MIVLELYSGIGGMHYALKESGCSGKVVLSVDINPSANKVYRHNFSDVKLLNKNIQSLNIKYLNSLNADTILMSPPCQPFTRNGLKNDVRDPRTESFLYILDLIPSLNVRNILIENVKGFEESIMRDKLIETFVKNDFIYQEFLLNPIDFGIPNSRLRYYCLARKKPYQFEFENGPLLTQIPLVKKSKDCLTIANFLENSSSYEYLAPNTQKYWKILDICNRDSTRSCCFTKAYGRYLEGTGSVFVEGTSEELLKFKNTGELNNLKLRYFTPKEVSKLMCFPESFSFPMDINNKQKYKLLGNSINVKVVAELIKLFQ